MPAKHEAGEMPANWVSGLFDGGLKGRLWSSYVFLGLKWQASGRLSSYESEARFRHLKGRLQAPIACHTTRQSRKL
jgi:hypothetical protein